MVFPVVYQVKTDPKNGVFYFFRFGQRITFYLEGQQLGKTLTGGDGYGFLKVTPERKGMQEIEVQTEKDKGSGCGV